nr:ribonuclease H-like domain-containing protein [Tanacetum cinerariifolium]
MDTEEVSARFVAPCFVNGLEAYDGEINLGVEENMISNKYAVKLCLEYEVKKGNRVVNKELIVALKGEIYFVKFIINPEEDDFEPEVIFRRSFLRMTKSITDFRVRSITLYPDIDRFLEETKGEEKSNDDWDRLLDFNIDDVPLLGEEGLLPFVCKMGKSGCNKKRAMENLNFFYQDVGTSSSAEGHLTQEEAAKEAIAIRISRKFALLEEERPIIETMAYHDKYKKILDEVWKDKVELDGKIVKEEEDATLGRDDMKKVDRGITMINHTQAKAIGTLSNVLCRVGVTTLIAKFLILDILIDHDSPIVIGRGFLRTIGGIVNTLERLFLTFDGFCHQTFCAARSDIMRNAKSDSDEEEDYQIKKNKFRAPIYGPKPEPYLNYNDLDERSLALQIITNPFRKISVWKKAVSFLGSLPVQLKQVNWKPDYKTQGAHDDEAGSSRSKRSRNKTVEEVLLPQVHHEFLLWEGCNGDAKSRYNTRLGILLPRHIYSPCIVYWDVLNKMGYDGEIDDMLRIRLREAGSNEEIFTFVAWIRAFNINEPIYAELCHEFYSAYEFYEVCVDDELQTKKIIKFRLGGLHSDEHFNAQYYSLSISREENLGLSRSHTSTIKNPILRVIHKVITYGLYQRTTGYVKIQKNDLWLLSMFDARHQSGVFTEDVMISLRALIHCRDLDTTMLRDLIDSDDVNHINFFDIEYPKISNDDERVANDLNKDKSDSSGSSVSGSNINTVDFPIDSGFGQKEGIDYEETFSPVVKMVTVRCLLNITVSMSWHVFQVDVNNVFLYGDFKETPRQWNAKLTSILIENGFSQSKFNYSLYTKSDKGVFLALLVCVDDIIITGNSVSNIEKFKLFLKSKFMIKDLGKVKYFLGIEVVDTDKGLGIHITWTSGMFLNAYSGADWAKCIITRKSATRYCGFLNNSLVSWKSSCICGRTTRESNYHIPTAPTWELE